MKKLKGSTLLETIVATLIIVASFLILTDLATLLLHRTAGYSNYVKMRVCRDSVITDISKGIEFGYPLQSNWGTLELNMNGDEVVVESYLTSGQRFLIYYLTDGKQ